MTEHSGKKEERRRILVVEDDPEMRRLLSQELTDEGYVISEAENGEDAAGRMSREAFHLVITDLVMPKMGGLDLLSSIKHSHPQIPVILITAFGDNASFFKAFQNRAISYICKPFKTKELKEAVKKALQGDEDHSSDPSA